MAWEEIGAAAIYGAIGGGVGALIGSLLAAPFRNSKIGRTMTTVLTVAGAIFGYNFAEPLLKPYIGVYIDGLVGSGIDAKVDAAMTELRADPMMRALLAREPGFEEEARAALADALKTGKNEEARQKAFEWGRGVGMSRLPHYLARGQNEDIISFAVLFADTVDALKAISPGSCYRWAFGGFGSDPNDSEALDKALGDGGIRNLTSLAGRLIENAYDEIPAYDEASAQAAVEEAARAMYDRLGPDRMAFATGAKQASAPEDQADVCAAMGAMFRQILARDNAADTLRHIYRQAG